ncbi:hypothetical protein AJ87_32310 [Rhizobium yanglingense]|nr:hypothetical protein AJ87_32310 [Rhizobium yanglingense]
MSLSLNIGGAAGGSIGPDSSKVKSDIERRVGPTEAMAARAPLCGAVAAKASWFDGDAGVPGRGVGTTDWIAVISGVSGICVPLAVIACCMAGSADVAVAGIAVAAAVKAGVACGLEAANAVSGWLVPSAAGTAAIIIASSPGFGVGTTLCTAVNSAWDVYSTVEHPAIPQSIVVTTRPRFRPENPFATILSLS